MNELNPPRRRFNLVRNSVLAAGIALSAGGLGAQIFADQIAGSRVHDFITISKQDYSKASATINNSSIESTEYKDAYEVIRKELVEQTKVKEEEIIQVKRTGNTSLGIGVVLIFIGIRLSSLQKGSHSQGRMH